MIINKKTYEVLSTNIINHFDYVLIRFHISNNKISSELIVLQDIKPYLYHLKKHLYITIFDTNLYHTKSQDYISHLKSIKNDKLSYIDNFEFSNIIVMLTKEYPSFVDFLANTENIENEIAIIKQTTDAVNTKLNNIQKKFNKLIDFSFTKGNLQELENFKINRFQEYIDAYLNPSQDKLQTNEDLFIKQEIEGLEDKLKKLIDVREFVPVDYDIGKIKREIAVLKQKQKFDIPKHKPKNSKLTISLKERETLKKDFLNSDEFEADLEVEKQRLIQANIELYLTKEQLKTLAHLFFDNDEHIIKNDSIFEEKKSLLIKEAYKKLHPIYMKSYINTGELAPKLKTYSQNIYTRFQREIITINLYTLEHTYGMNEEVRQSLVNIYKNSDRQFNNLSSNIDVCMNIINLDILEEEIKYNEANDYSIKTDFFNHLLSLGIDGNDWQEKAEELGIEIPYEHIFGEEVEYLEDTASKIEIFQDDITIQEFNNFLENNSLNKFNTSTNAINTTKTNQPHQEELPF